MTALAVSLNHQFLQAINGLAGHSRLLDNIMIFSAKYLIYAAFFVLVLVSLRHLQRRQWPRLLGAGAGLVLAFGLGVLASLVYFEPRPFTTVPGLRVLTPHDPGKSFPSDHAIAAFAVAFVLLAFLSYRWGLIVLASAILIGFARVYVGVHYPGDIAGAALLAALAVGFARMALNAASRQPALQPWFPSTDRDRLGRTTGVLSQHR